MMPVATATEGIEAIITSQHVDDLSHGLAARSEAKAVEKFLQVGERASKEILRAKLTIADNQGGAEVTASCGRRLK